MDIEGFVRARIDDYSYEDLADILAVRIREYKNISQDNSVEMAKAVIDEVSTTLKLQESDDEFLKEIANVNKADVLMGEMGVGSRGAGDFFVHRKIAEIVSSTNTASLVNPSEQDDGGVVKAPVKNDEVYITFRNTSRYPLNITSEELMERFVRGDSSRNTEGSGLGLSIAQSLTELMNGSMKLEIDGDLFKVTLKFHAIHK